MLLGGYDAGGEISFPQGLGVSVDAPFDDLLSGTLELALSGLFAKNLAGLEETDEAVTQTHGHSGVAQSIRAADGVCLVGGQFGQGFLDRQAGGASPAFLGN